MGYIDSETAAKAVGLSLRTVQRLILSGELMAEVVPNTRSRGGITYRIPLESLPVEAQVRYWMSEGGAQAQAGDADIAGYKDRYGEEGLRELLKSQAAAREAIGRLNCLISGRGAVYEEIAARYGVSTRTIRRWEAAYRAEGLKGLMKPIERADKGESRTICAWAGDYIKHTYVCGQAGGINGGNTKKTQSAAYERLIEEAERLGDGACDMCPYCEGSWRREELSRKEKEAFPACKEAKGRMIVPGNRYAVNRYMKSVSDQLKTYGRYGSRAWEAQYMQKTRRDKPARVNECWFGDHHRFDLFVLGEDGVPFRPWLTAWTDACSGVFVGWMLTQEPNSDTIAESFCRAAAYKAGSDIHGLPGAVYVDNGKDYRSARFEGGKVAYRGLGRLNERFDPDGEGGDNAKSLLQYFDVNMIRAQPYKAWSKTIERLFGVIEGRWIRELPGWCGDSPGERPQDMGGAMNRPGSGGMTNARVMEMARRGELLTFETFAKIWAQKILPEYNAHKGADGRSPGEIYKSAERYPTPTPSWDTLAMMKSQTAQRKVETTGIRFQNARYWNEALDDYIGKYVTVRFNRGYNESITVTSERKYVCEAEIAQNMRMIGEDREKIESHMRAQAAQRAKVTDEIKRLNQSMKGRDMRAAYAQEIDEQRDAYKATYVSMEARKARAGREEAEARRAGRKKKAAQGADKVVSMLEARGAALAEKAAEI